MAGKSYMQHITSQAVHNRGGGPFRARTPHAGATHRRRTNLGCAGSGCAAFFVTSWKKRQAAAAVALSPLSKSALSPL
jgi:hypothetical protein